MSDQELDLSAVFLEIEPGYVIVTSESGDSKILFVPPAMELGLGLRASVGFELDGSDVADLGTPIFLHKKMKIHQLGPLQKYMADPFVREKMLTVVNFFDHSLGALPIISCPFGSAA